MGGSRGGDRGSGPPLKNHKNIVNLSNTGPDPLKNNKDSETPFKWRLAGGPMMAHL